MAGQTDRRSSASAQTLADRANRYGTWFCDELQDALWVGCPLLVHRRCLDPMFTISNIIAYDNKMVYGTAALARDSTAGPSRWIHMDASSSDGHWVEDQGQKAMTLVQELTSGDLRSNGQPKVFVITPFKLVAQKTRALFERRFRDEVSDMVGTVHTFQGKEAEHVILLLCGDPRKPGVISRFAGAKPNLVNVAVTRAKRRLYVIGDRNFWTGPADVHQIYTRLAMRMDEALESLLRADSC